LEGLHLLAPTGGGTALYIGAANVTFGYGMFIHCNTGLGISMGGRSFLINNNTPFNIWMPPVNQWAISLADQSQAFVNYVNIASGVGNAILASSNTHVNCYGCQITGGNWGLFGEMGSRIIGGNCQLFSVTYAVYIHGQAYAYMGSSYVRYVTNGFDALNGGMIDATSCSVKNASGTAYHAIRGSLILAPSTNANNATNGTNYSPATSDTVGNVNSVIQWS
jgi:hypothetical protein